MLHNFVLFLKEDILNKHIQCNIYWKPTKGSWQTDVE